MKFGHKAMAVVITLLSSIENGSNALVSPNYNRHNRPFTSSIPFQRKFSILLSTSASTVEKTSEADQYSNLAPEFMAAKELILAKIEQSSEHVSPMMMSTLTHFIDEYFLSCNTASLSPDSTVTAETTTKAMSDVITYGLQHGLLNPYNFSTTHTALRGIDPSSEDGNTIDYYKFGIDFFKPCMDVEKSLVLGQDNLEKAKQQLAAGENVVFFANHQSEADPQVVSVTFEKAGFGDMAEDMVYVAGHKVTTDPLAVPFSMGRNLICIHSKKHLDADPETKGIKMKQNLQAMGGMLKMLASETGVAIWVAPSGGRDRRDVETEEVPIAKFDKKTVDMFRLLGNKSKKPTHFYAMGMVTYDLCPPPDVVEAGVGEQRNVRFVPVGVSISEELIVEGGIETRDIFMNLAFEKCDEGYGNLLNAMKE